MHVSVWDIIFCRDISISFSKWREYMDTHCKWPFLACEASVHFLENVRCYSYQCNTWILGFPECTALWEISAHIYFHFWREKNLTHTCIVVVHFTCLHYCCKTLLNSLRMNQFFYKTRSRSVTKFPTMQCILENPGSTYSNQMDSIVILILS